jgi:anti-sigma factor RsiW
VTCRRTRRRLAAYLDDELSVDLRIEVDGHLEVCAHCARIAEGERKLSRAVRLAASDRLDGEIAERLRVAGGFVLSRIAAEREVARTTGVRGLTDNLHQLWLAGAACVATAVCAFVVASVISTVQSPDSLAAMMEALSNPGSNENPVQLRTGMVAPQLSPDAVLLTLPEPMPLPGRPTGVTFAVVVTREGTVSGLEVIDSNGPDPLSWHELVDSAFGARFQPAEYRGAPVAVNMVWVVEQVTILADAAVTDFRGAALRPLA